MAHLDEARVIKTRTLQVRENGYKKTAFVVEMSDGSRWYTTKGGNVAFKTFDKIVSGTNIDNLCDNDFFSYYGETKENGNINTMEKFVELINL